MMITSYAGFGGGSRQAAVQPVLPAIAWVSSRKPE
jgi:hypothetical protein